MVFSSCKKEEEVEYSTDKTMTAKLEGNLWRAVEPKGSNTGDGLYRISGESKIGHKIDLYLNSVSVGTYNLSATATSKAEYTMPNNGGFYVTQNGAGTSGYIELSDVDTISKKVTGKFYFVANQLSTHYLKTISDGKFENIEYTYVAPSAANNFLTATVSGTSFTATSVMGTNSGNITIIGSDGTTNFYVVVPSDITSGTYTVDGSIYSLTYNLYPDNYLTDNGSITITSHNTTVNQIIGTFSMSAHNVNDATDIVTVTNGSFEVVY
jgi:hypothetical protein